MNAVWIFREKIVMFSRSPHDLKFDLSRRSQDENGIKKIYENVKRTCRACKAIVFAHKICKFMAFS